MTAWESLNDLSAFVRNTSLHCNRNTESALKHAFLHYLLIKVQLKANRHPTFMGQSARAPPIPIPTHHDPGSQNMKWRALFDDRRMERISFVQRIDYRQPRSMPLDPNIRVTPCLICQMTPSCLLEIRAGSPFPARLKRVFRESGC